MYSFTLERPASVADAAKLAAFAQSTAAADRVIAQVDRKSVV